MVRKCPYCGSYMKKEQLLKVDQIPIYSYKCTKCEFHVFANRIDDEEFLMKKAAQRYRDVEEMYNNSMESAKHFKELLDLASEKLKRYLLAKRL